MNGEGEFIWPDNRRFKGFYVDGKKHGKGVFTWPDGKNCKGTWENGEKKDVEFFDGENPIPSENKDRLSIDYSKKQSVNK